MNLKKLCLLLFLFFLPLSCAGKYMDAPGIYAVMDTSMGSITIELDFQKAPVSTANFVRYAREGFYAGTIFHRVISNFMIQGGQFDKNLDKKNEGIHAPILNEWQNGLKNTRGTIAMARTHQPDSATAQFFINTVDNPDLDNPRGGAAYAVFGKVIEGMDVVDKIKNTPCAAHPKYPGPAVVPKKAILIKGVAIQGQYDEEALERQMTAADRRMEDQKKAREDSVAAVIASLEAETSHKAQKTETGLYYIPIKSGSGKNSPDRSSTVKVHYEGKLLDGSVFDSSYARGETIEFPLNGVIPGWTEGIPLMKTGGSCYLVIPPQLAYGDAGAGNVIPPNAWLVFKVELFSFK